MKKIIIFFLFFFICFPGIKAENITDQINHLNNNTDNLATEVSNLNHIDKLYPIGSIYITVTDENPSNKIGGTWERYSAGKKLIGVGNNGTTTYNYNNSGGSKTKTLSLDNLPAHNHSLTPEGTINNIFQGISVNTNSNGAHNHTLKFNNASNEAKGYGLMPTTPSGNKPLFWNRVVVISDTINGLNTYSSGDHTHTLTPEGTVDSKFTGEKTTTSSTGNNTTFNIMNPYITVYMWKRIA